MDAADDAAALSEAERQKREAEVMADALAVERKEVALIWHAERDGEILDFRANT